jgi:hypothetical protein
VRFVDEFRDAELAQAVGAQIASLCEPGRHYKIMEVCGGHTHSIFRFLKLRHLVAYPVHQALSFQVYRVIGVVASRAPEIDHQSGVFLPLGAALVDLRQPLLLVRGIGDHPLKRQILGFEVLPGIAVRLEKSRIAGDEISSHAGLHFQHQPEQAAAGGHHMVAMLHPKHGSVHVIGFQQQHSCQHRHGKQRQQHSPAEQNFKGLRFHSA